MNEPHEIVYFTDRDLGHQFPEKLRAAGLRVERHDDHFGQLTPDPEWIGEIGRRGWVALTRDARIRYSPLAVETLMESGARLFVIVGRLTTEEAAAILLRQRKRIERLLRKESKPFIGKIRRDTVEVWLRRRDRRQ
ncbi:MAG: hypothetical protein AB7U95_23370 [Reyranella sp.]